MKKELKLVKLRCKGLGCPLRKGFNCREEQKGYYKKKVCPSCGTAGAIEINIIKDRVDD